MSKQKPISGGQTKKKAEVSLVRSSAAEYLTLLPSRELSVAGTELLK
jgi:hypothetical protein